MNDLYWIAFVLAEGQILCYLVIYLVAKSYYKRSGPSEQLKAQKVIDSVKRASLVGGTVVTVLLAASYAQDHWDRLANLLFKFFQLPGITGIVILLTLFLGAFGYFAKKKHTALYGLIEIGIGVAGAVVTMYHVSAPDKVLPAIMAIAGCVYVIVRGFSNVDDGKEVLSARIASLIPEPNDSDEPFVITR